MKKTRYSQDEWMEMGEKRKQQICTDAQLISDEFPSVKVITVRYKRETTSFERSMDKDWQALKRGSMDKFCLFIPCINCTCVEWGYFDMRKKIKEAIVSRLLSCEGTMNCEGWEDAERVDTFHCPSSVQYEISIDYV